MDNPPSAKVCAVEPSPELLLRRLRAAVSAVGGFCWQLLEVSGWWFLILAAGASIVGGALQLAASPERWYLATPLIAFGVAFFVSARFRLFLRRALGFAALWCVVVTAGLALVLGLRARIESPEWRMALLALYLLPPLLAAVVSGYVRHRRVRNMPGRKPFPL